MNFFFDPSCRGQQEVCSRPAPVHGRLFRRATAPLPLTTTATRSLAGIVKPPALGLNSKLLSRPYREIALAAVTAFD